MGIAQTFGDLPGIPDSTCTPFPNIDILALTCSSPAILEGKDRVALFHWLDNDTTRNLALAEGSKSPAWAELKKVRCGLGLVRGVRTHDSLQNTQRGQEITPAASKYLDALEAAAAEKAVA